MEQERPLAIVTGGGRGIGQATALGLAEDGFRIAVVDRDLAKAEDTVNAILAAGGDAQGWVCDVAKPQEVQRLMTETIAHYGRIDVLVNNAGIIMPGFIEEISDADWLRVVSVNLSGVFYCIKYAMPALKKRRGCIVNVASMNGLVGQLRNPAYSATKGGVIALTRAVAIDVAPMGVRVNAVCPAGVATPLLEEWFQSHADPGSMRQATDLSHMLGRTATPEEIAAVIRFLASAQASFITGQAIPVEGGATLGYGAGPKPEWTAGKFVPRRDDHEG
ncbi:MAG: SDR family NAD(P)-dependent oxidoreductase [Firmicutes bacterium]|nr:SDR family NAD(P)-dependent oxidoreductase [Bacillota bacterium]